LLKLKIFFHTQAFQPVEVTIAFCYNSFNIQEITQYAQAYLSLENKNIMTSRLPFDGLNTSGMIDGTSYVIPITLADNAKVLHYLLFGDEYFIPSDTLQDISDRIVNYSGYGSIVDWSVTTPQMILDEMAITSASDTGESEILEENILEDTYVE